MARNLQIGETVYAPCSRVVGLESTGVALYRTQVTTIDGRKAKVKARMVGVR